MVIELPIPKDGESQVDFAIRFHAEMADSLPTDERNAECFRLWRDIHGPTEEELIAQKTFSAEKYRHVQDVALFDEHETPRDRYQQQDLAGIVATQNKRIRTRSIFAPITDGHTTDDPKDPEPKVVGYVGALRLGMVDNEDPKWCIFADEYHHRDNLTLLNEKRGRSVETYRMDAKGKFIPPKDRFFYPVAALGSSLPRLALPPARYASDRSDIERYAMPGGGNVSPFGGGEVKKPESNPDRYAEPDDDQDPLEGISGTDREVVVAILKALMESDVVQDQIAKAETQAGFGSVGPRIPNVIPPAQAGQPGAPGTTGAQPPGMPPGSMNPMSGHSAGAAQMPGQQQSQQNGENKMPLDNGNPAADQKKPEPVKYSNSASAAEMIQSLEARLTQHEGTIRQLVDELASERSRRVEGERYSVVSALAERYAMDPKKELSRVKAMTDEQFGEWQETVKECYRYKAESVPDFSGISNGRDTDKAPQRDGGDELSEVTVQDVVKYATAHNLDYTTARARYVQELDRAKA